MTNCGDNFLSIKIYLESTSPLSVEAEYSICGTQNTYPYDAESSLHKV